MENAERGLTRMGTDTAERNWPFSRKRECSDVRLKSLGSRLRENDIEDVERHK